MEPVVISTISLILALVVLAENTIGLWKITQGIKTLQDGQKAIMEALERISKRLES
jgi:hypothetical protein